MKIRIKQVKEVQYPNIPRFGGFERVDALSAQLYKLKDKIQPAFYDKVRAFINKGDLAKAEEFLNRVSSIGGGTYIDATKEAATFTDKHDDNPKLKGGQKDLPDELQAKIVAKEGKNYKFNIGDKLQTYGGEESVTVVGVQPHLAAALKDDKNPLAIDNLKKALRQDLVDREQANQPWYLVKFEGGLPDTDLRYWAEDELEPISSDDLNEGESNLTPLQQYIYDYEVEISGEDFANEELENIKKLNTISDVEKYYGAYRGWDNDKDFKYDLIRLIKTLKSKKLAEGEVGEDFNKQVEDFIAKHINIIKDAAKFYKNRPDDYEDSLIQTIYNFFERYASKDWENLTMDWPDEKDEVFYNALKSVLSKKNINEDHEVGMAHNLLDDIIKNAAALKMKLGGEERNIPGWIQDHISQAQNYISQANTNFHEDNNEAGDEAMMEAEMNDMLPEEAEQEFDKLMQRYDWYAEMSDDYRAYDRMISVNRRLLSLADKFDANKAVDIFNKYAPKGAGVQRYLDRTIDSLDQLRH